MIARPKSPDVGAVAFCTKSGTDTAPVRELTLVTAPPPVALTIGRRGSVLSTVTFVPGRTSCKAVSAFPSEVSTSAASDSVGRPAAAVPLTTLIWEAVPMIVAGRLPVFLPFASKVVASSTPAPLSGTSARPIAGSPASPAGLLIVIPAPCWSVRVDHSPSLRRTAKPDVASAASFWMFSGTSRMRRQMVDAMLFGPLELLPPAKLARQQAAILVQQVPPELRTARRPVLDLNEAAGILMQRDAALGHYRPSARISPMRVLQSCRASRLAL
ncbi:hypothetical protein SNK04_014414 [Fusarium graminearum]